MRLDGAGDRVLYSLTAVAGLLAMLVLGEIVYQVIHGAGPSSPHFGLAFIWHSRWAPK